MREKRVSRKPVGNPATARPSVKMVVSSPVSESEKPYCSRTSWASSGNSCRSAAFTAYEVSRTQYMAMATDREPDSPGGALPGPGPWLEIVPPGSCSAFMPCLRGWARSHFVIPNEVRNPSAV